MSWWKKLFGGSAPENTDTLTDVDGNTYRTIRIGKQLWMAENLNTTKYNDGTSIAHVTEDADWKAQTAGAYCYYDNDESNAAKFGALYNWHAVSSKKFCPKGWHVPTDEEWKALEKSLGMSQGEAEKWGLRGRNEGSKLAGMPEMWDSGRLTSDGSFGSSGFNALPAGARVGAVFCDIGSYANFWCSTPNVGKNSFFRYIKSNDTECQRDQSYQGDGLSIRCVHD